MKIGELARSSGVNSETIRYYEKIGLLPRALRTDSNYRDYGPHDVERLAFIRHARGLGFELADIRSLIDLAEQPDRDCGEVDAIVALYAPDAVLQDPIVAPKRVGGEIRDFFQGAVDAMGGIDMQLDGEVRVSGNHGAAAYTVHIALEDGRHAYIDTLDVMTFNDDGLITSQVAYWGTSNVVVSPTEKARR